MKALGEPTIRSSYDISENLQNRTIVATDPLIRSGLVQSEQILPGLCTEPLPKLAITVSEELKETARMLVRKKYEFDRFARKLGGANLISGLWGSYGEPLDGTDFFRKLFPFAPVWNSEGEPLACIVPVEYTFGCSWRWRKEHLNSKEIEKCLQRVTSHENANRYGYNSAQYMWIEPLGLILANEGKNRVDFIREMLEKTSVEGIPASVNRYDYPRADRISLYEVDANGREEVWAVLDRRYVERLQFPDWTLPVLSAYGVRSGGKSWPNDFPGVAIIDAAFSCPSGAKGFLNSAIVDMAPIKRKNDKNNEIVRCSINEIEGLKMHWPFWITITACYVLCVVLLSLLPPSWTLVHNFLCGAVGAGLGVMAMTSLRAFKMKFGCLRSR